MECFVVDFVLADYMYRHIAVFNIGPSVSKQRLVLKCVHIWKSAQKGYGTVTVILLCGFIMTNRRRAVTLKIEVRCCVVPWFLLSREQPV
jgi:hypothetical protein